MTAAISVVDEKPCASVLKRRSEDCEDVNDDSVDYGREKEESNNKGDAKLNAKNRKNKKRKKSRKAGQLDASLQPDEKAGNEIRSNDMLPNIENENGSDVVHSVAPESNKLKLNHGDNNSKKAMQKDKTAEMDVKEDAIMSDSSTPLTSLSTTNDDDKEHRTAVSLGNQGGERNLSDSISNNNSMALWGYSMVALSACTQAVRAALFHGAMTRSTISPSASLFVSGVTFTILSFAVIFIFRLHDRVFKIPRKQVIQLVMRGLISGIMVFTNTYALSLIPVGTALTLFATAPAITSVLAAIFLNDPLTVADAFVLLANLVGVTLVARPSTVSSQTSTTNFSVISPDRARELAHAWGFVQSLLFTPNEAANHMFEKNNNSPEMLGMSLKDVVTSSSYTLSNTESQALRQALIGVVVALTTAVLIATAYTLVKAMGTRVHFVLNLLSIGLGCLFVSAFLINSSDFYSIQSEVSGTFTIIAGATAGFIAQALLNRAVQLCRPGPALVVRSMNVPVSIALGWIFFRESVPPSSVLGTAIVLFSVIYIGLSHIWRNARRAAVPNVTISPTRSDGLRVQPPQTAVATYGAIPQVQVNKIASNHS